MATTVTTAIAPTIRTRSSDPPHRPGVGHPPTPGTSPEGHTMTANTSRRLVVVGVAVALVLGGIVVGVVGLRASDAHPAAPAQAQNSPLGNGMTAALQSTAQS